MRKGRVEKEKRGLTAKRMSRSRSGIETTTEEVRGALVAFCYGAGGEDVWAGGQSGRDGS
jgi:hypothetical protein